MTLREDVDLDEADMLEACREILHHRRTGMRRGDVLKRIAVSHFTAFGEESIVHAESFVLLRAADSLLRIRHRSDGIPMN